MSVLVFLLLVDVTPLVLESIYVWLAATVVISCSVFWFFNILLMILDTTGRPQYLLRFKIQEGKNQPASVMSVYLQNVQIFDLSLLWK